MSRLSVLTRPRQLLLTFLAAGIVATCVSLGQWQLRRLDEAQAERTTVLVRSALPPSAIEDLVASGASAEELAFRPATARGRFLTEGEIAITNRTRDERVGSDLVTPLELEDGRIVFVRRGWVPIESAEPPVAQAAPPAGEVTVRGVVVGSEPRRPFTPPLPDGRLTQAARLDIARFAEQFTAPVLEVAIVATSVTPDAGRALPVPITLDPPGLGPHRSYAVQWFLFAAIALVTYGLLLRRALRRPTLRS